MNEDKLQLEDLPFEVISLVLRYVRPPRLEPRLTRLSVSSPWTSSYKRRYSQGLSSSSLPPQQQHHSNPQSAQSSMPVHRTQQHWQPSAHTRTSRDPSFSRFSSVQHRYGSSKR